MAITFTVSLAKIIKEFSLEPLVMEKNPEEGEKCWDMLVKVATEINGKMPWFLSEETAPRTTACPATMAARAFRKDGKVAVLVTNRTAKPASGEVRLEDGTAFPVDLPPYGVVWR